MSQYNHQRFTHDRQDPTTGRTALSAMASPVFDSSRLTGKAIGAAPENHRGTLLVLALVFAAGMYVGLLLFGDRPDHTPTIVYCPSPGSAPAALLPAECNQRQAVIR